MKKIKVLGNEIEDYQLVDADSAEQLEELIRQKIKHGWQPFGPPFYGGGMFLQGLVRYEENYE